MDTLLKKTEQDPSSATRTQTIGMRSFSKNLYVSIGGFFVFCLIFFSIEMRQREMDYRLEIVRSQIETFTYEMAFNAPSDSLLSSHFLQHYLKHCKIKGLEITVLDTLGNVLAECRHSKAHSRFVPEKYCSTSSRIPYSGHTIEIRSSVPVTAEIIGPLKYNIRYLIVSIVIIVVLISVLYLNTRRVTRHIDILRQFALKAEEDNSIDIELERQLPDDELGDISHTIISLYGKQRHAQEENQRIKRQLTQNVAHELKTPAASIHGYLESILDEPDMPSATRQHFLERCYAQSERMNRLLMDMTSLTKLDAMADTVTREAVSLNDTIASVLDDTAKQLCDKGITASVSMPDCVVVHGDAQLLYSIFRNLVDNTIAYGVGATSISVVCSEKPQPTPQKHIYEFCVSDNGSGVDPQHLPYLFERFYRVDKGRSRRVGGTGLGMAIVKNAVIVHGGEIAAELAPGGGLAIRFTLPGFL